MPPPPSGDAPKPPAPPGAPGADASAISPGAKAVRDAIAKALEDALKDSEFAESLEVTGKVTFDVSKDTIEVETDDVVFKSGGDAAKPEGDKPAADKPPAPPPPPPKG